MSDRLAAYAVEVANALREAKHPAQVITMPNVVGWYLRNEISFYEERSDPGLNWLREGSIWQQLILESNGTLHHRQVHYRAFFRPRAAIHGPDDELWEHGPLGSVVNTGNLLDLDFLWRQKSFSRVVPMGIRFEGWVLERVRKIHLEPGQGIGIALTSLRASATGSSG